MIDRLRSSGEMVSGALASGSPNLVGSSSSDKSTSATPGSAGRAESALHESSQARPPQGQPGRIAETFKSHQGSDDSQAAFDAFMSGQGSHPLQQHTQATLTEPTAADFEAQDGAAVVDLLSRPHDFDMEPTHEDRDDRITPELAAKLREVLFGPGAPRLNWDNLLDFTPNFVQAPAGNPEEAALHLGTTDQGLAREIWLGQWEDVLSAYNDEVWGDLGELVQGARDEVEKLASREPDSDQGDHSGAERGALGRLRMILAHVRGSE